ncbi:5-formyltetrahydrofolate cyclo-ligase [Oceanobacillus halotolerans]|uniref:5-formyltetrahydrofolate cyclo-ligase n=1 Tax=Oceanobacillus halotolerans TaxID=2663380 RepID=UPI001CF7A7BA|nr:5-formyltetrahydrofolate cyclo-ligase [Oceanobacillus halotolerans]
MDKSEWRKDMITTLKQLPVEDKKQIEEKLLANLVNSPLWKSAKVIGITVSQGFEWNTKPIIEAAWKSEKSVCVPKCIPDEKKLMFYQINSFEQLEVVYYSLLEPIPDDTIFIPKKEIDLLVVPGLVFDKNGYRIGFGGGYYDRFLADFPNKTVSLLSTLQLIDRINADQYDLPVHHLITENGMLT